MKLLLVPCVGLLFVLGLGACGETPSAPSSGIPSTAPQDRWSCPPEPPYANPTARIPCPSSREIAEINRDISIEFRGDPTAGSRVCRASEGSEDLTFVQARIFMQLSYMRHLSFSRPLPWTDKPLYEWFRQMTRGIVIESGYGFSHYNQKEKVIYAVYRPGMQWNESWLVLEAADPAGLIHEARHGDGGVHRCGFAGDNTIAEMGAWGAQYMFDVWVAQYSTEDQATRDYFAYNAWLLISSRTVFCSECGGRSAQSAVGARPAGVRQMLTWPGAAPFAHFFGPSSAKVNDAQYDCQSAASAPPPAFPARRTM